MKLVSFLLILSAVNLCASASAEPLFCQDFDGTVDGLRKCNQKVVKLIASMTTTIEQHPTGLLKRLDPENNTLTRQHETYVEFGNPPLQIVLVSREPIACTHQVEVSGVVQRVDLAGRHGTKEEYTRPWIEVQAYTCR